MTNFMWYIAIVVAGLGGWKFGTVLGNIAVEWWEDTTGTTLPG